MFDLAGRTVFVAGHKGMVGSAIVRRLAGEPCRLLTAARAELDLRSQAAVRAFFERRRPDVVIVAAARVGGIQANDAYPADFLHDNIAIASNVIDAAWRSGAAKLLFLGASCVYPRLTSQPISEDALLTGSLEPTNEWYAIAKIAGIKLCQAYRRQHGCDYISCLPTNLYGPNDSFDLDRAHVLPALLRKAYEAKRAVARAMVVWGSGTPRREFLHVDDMADACVFLLKAYSGELPLNIGWGEDISIAELAGLVKEIVGYRGGTVFDTSKPDGMPRKLLDATRIRALGWQPRITLRE